MKKVFISAIALSSVCLASAPLKSEYTGLRNTMANGIVDHHIGSGNIILYGDYKINVAEKIDLYKKLRTTRQENAKLEDKNLSLLIKIEELQKTIKGLKRQWRAK